MLSRSHCTPAPAMATEPSSAYAVSACAPRRQHTVDRSPRVEATGAPGPVLSSAKHPVPYVLLPRRAPPPLAERRCVLVADGGGDGDAASAPDATVPNAFGSAQETICRQSRAAHELTLACVSHCSVRRFISIVRLALVQSVTNRAPFVSLPLSHAPPCPCAGNAVGPPPASAQLSNSQRIFVPAKYVLMGKPQVSQRVLASQVPLQVGADLRRARVQPHDGVVQRFPRFGVPRHDGLALVRDAHARDVGGGRAARNLGQRARHALVRVRHDLLGVVLAPTGLGEDLLVLHLMRRHGGELRARGRLDPVQDELRGRRALVQRAHQRGGHVVSVWWGRDRARRGVSSTRDDRACLVREGQ